MNERIKEIRKFFGLNQTEFGKRIGIKQGSVAGYESGSRVPMDSIVTSICREFGVSEHWLRTGEGEMIIPKTMDEEIIAFIGEIQSSPEDNFKKRIAHLLAKMSDDEWKMMERFANKLVAELEEEKKKG